MLLGEAERILRRNGYKMYLNEEGEENTENIETTEDKIDETKFKWDMRIQFGKDEQSIATVWLLADPKSISEKNEKNLMGGRIWMIMEAEGNDMLVKAKQCLVNCASILCMVGKPFNMNIMKGGKTVLGWKSVAPITAIDSQESAKKKEQEAENKGTEENA